MYCATGALRDCTAMWIVTPRPLMSAVQLSSGMGQISAASSSDSVRGRSSPLPGWSAAIRRASRTTWPVSAVTSGATWASSAPNINTVRGTAGHPIHWPDSKE